MILKNKYYLLIIGISLFLFLPIGCDDVQIFITNTSPQDMSLCNGMIFELTIYQTENNKATFSAEVKNDQLSFLLSNSEKIDFNKKVNLKLKVIQEGSDEMCRFKRGLIYRIDNTILKKAGEGMKIYTVDINLFYQSNRMED